MNASTRPSWHGIDLHVLMTLLFRGWTIVAGAITVVVVPMWLSPTEQGYYYTFASILALQIFFELGMGQVVIQIVAHEAVHLHQRPDGCYDGPPQALARLSGMLRFLNRWYRIAALLFLVTAGIAGWLFFRNGELPWHDWLGPWMLLVAATAGNLMLSWRIAVVEGFTLVRDVSRMRMIQSMAGYAVTWLALTCGAALWIVCLLPITTLLYSTYWLRQLPAAPIMRLDQVHEVAAADSVTFNWRVEVLPFQWRIAVSWIAGFFIFQLFTPVVFKHHGAVEAGRIGLGITVFNAVVSVGSSWMAAKVPTIGQLLARGQRAQASALFHQLTRNSVALVAIVSLALVAATALLHDLDIAIAQRLPSTATALCLALAATGNAFVMSAAMFMRAHKEEPMLTSAVTVAIVTIATVALVAPLGAAWVAGGYATLVWLLSLPWTLILLRRFNIPSNPRASCGSTEPTR